MNTYIQNLLRESRLASQGKTEPSRASESQSATIPTRAYYPPSNTPTDHSTQNHSQSEPSRLTFFLKKLVNIADLT
jgi:hypothetical protein